MDIANFEVVQEFVAKHVDAAVWLEGWARTVRRSNWQNLMELRQDYPSADGVRTQNNTVVTVFNVKGNEYRLLTHVNYQVQSVRVVELLTHAQYDKPNWKRRL